MDAQADLSLCGAHTHFVGFIMWQLICVNYYIDDMHYNYSLYTEHFCLFVALQDRIELHHDKTNKMACAPSEDSDQDPSFLHADREDSDQTGRMPRLI